MAHDIGSADAVCEYGVRDFGSSEGSRRSTGLFLSTWRGQHGIKQDGSVRIGGLSLQDKRAENVVLTVGKDTCSIRGPLRALEEITLVWVS